MNQEAARIALEGKAFYGTWQGMLVVRDNELLRLYRERLEQRTPARRSDATPVEQRRGVKEDGKR